MVYVIAAPRIDTKDASCTQVFPVDCIRPSEDEAGFAEAKHLFIDPEECVDCDAYEQSWLCAEQLCCRRGVRTVRYVRESKGPVARCRVGLAVMGGRSWRS
jgi:NAD-dependent dihydropyrimidine dehydrogenase PreA subunit